MKRFLIKFLLFVIVAVIGYTAVLLWSGDHLSPRWKKNLFYNMPSQGYMYTRLKDADTTKNLDILILGSSRAFMGYDVRVFNQSQYKAFNLGSPAQSFIQTELLAKRYINRFKPKVVLFDVHPDLFNNPGVESAIDLASNAPFGTDLLQMAIKVNNIRVYNTLLYSMYRQLFFKNNSYTEPMVKSYGDYIKGGSVQPAPQDPYKAPAVIKPYAMEVDDMQLKAFEQTIAYLNENHVKYILLQGPVEKTEYLTRKNNHQIDSLISSYGTYYNANKLLNLPDSLYQKDGKHLNQKGIEVYDKFIIKYLKDKTEL
ncbi:hypothetical protein [Mucilaginibacter lacusdianchii]|uniref:hypothetical protein n=1 Tax=Mucilaginibacter lacusdianchii TaxID=2684211 RepID=UPI00131AEEF7|nr:hypothetical protein [Mucilaginibacter sp. JXJ CY 39]